MTYQTTMLLSILVPKYVAAAEPEIPKVLIELHFRPIVIDLQNFTKRELRPAVLRSAIK